MPGRDADAMTDTTFHHLPVTHGRIADFARDPAECMRGLWEAHGEIAALEEDGQRVYFVFGPEYTKEVLSDSHRFHSRFFAVMGGRRSAQRRVTSGLLSMNGEEHRRQRRLVMEPFQKRSIAGYEGAVVAEAEETIGAWRHGAVRDINADMTRHMLRLTCRILFGLEDRDLAYQVGELTERWVALNHRIGPAAFTPNPMLTAGYDELLNAADELETAVKEMLRRKRAGQLGHDVMSLLIRAHDGEGGISDEQLIGHITLLFGAAHLTSAHTLSWTLFLLSQHPHVMRELHDEFREKLGGRHPRPDQLDDLPVLDRILKESMRILPASSYSQRLAAEDVRLGPFDLRRGNVVIFSQFITHRIPALYPEPERFLPDRWKSLTPSPYAYLPFGAGPRMCIGAALGMLQLKMTLPILLQRYRLNVVPHSEVHGRIMSTMLFPVGAMPMRVSEQDGCFTSYPVSGNIHSLVELPAAASSQASSRRAA